VFCIKCGIELPDGSNFCSKCGTNLGATNNDTPKNGKCLFNIERKKAWGGMLGSIKVYIDGELIKELLNGEVFSSVLKNGKHILYCDSFGYNRTSLEFVGNSNEISFFVSYPSTVQQLTTVNISGQTLILHKTKETEPGTYTGTYKGENNSNLSTGKVYSVITPTKILYERDSNSNVMKELDVGDQVSIQYDCKEKETLWYYVTAGSVEGWCKAEYLKEL
jgi:hypothetical protein